MSNKQTKQSGRTGILICGMHRSGTSALARALNMLGASLPDDLIGPDHGNRLGHWEPLSVNSLNNTNLEAMQRSWDDWRAADDAWFATEAGKAQRAEAIEQIEADFADAELLLLKDPRVSLTLPFWQGVLKDCSADTAVILCLRHPQEVAASLLKRNAMPKAYGVLLWLRYMLQAEAGSRGMVRAVLRYRSLLDDWRTALNQLSARLDIKFPTSLDDAADEIDGFLSPEEQHHRHADAALAADPKIASWIEDTFEIFNRWAADGEKKADYKKLDEIRAQLDLVAPLFSQLTQDAKQKPHLERQLQEVEDALEQAKQEAHKQMLGYMHHGEYLEHMLEEKQQEAASLKRQLARFERNPAMRIYRKLGRLLEHVPILKPMLRLVVQAMFKRPNPQEKANVARLMASDAFDADWYRETYKDVDALGLSPALHYLRYGGAERREPGPEFDVRHYLRQHPQLVDQGVNPVLHYLDEVAAQRERMQQSNLRLIAFYLPQYHEIAENNAWWGEGFTEWTNVKRGEPRFVGHDQPRIPTELGYYDLTDGETQAKQVALAKEYGLGGFCFYFYWFGGKRLLEQPILNYLEDKSLDMPFCLCWANENWTRTWDGQEQDILMAQDHSPDDDIAFIEYVSQYFADERYIRVDGKPVLVVYRPNALPEAMETAGRWRDWCHKNGIGEIHLVYSQGFEQVDPAEYGFDAAIEFPPNKAVRPTEISHKMEITDTDYEGEVYDWRVFSQRSSALVQPDYLLYRGINPGWDNECRRPNKGITFQHFNLEGFKHWLRSICRLTLDKQADKPEQQLIFINAWNEWGEGAYLEPDETYGRGKLEAMQEVLLEFKGEAKQSASGAAELTLPEGTQTGELWIVAHVFYLSIFEEMLSHFKQLNGSKMRLIVTCPDHLEAHVHTLYKGSGVSIPLTVHVAENHGRDILPFLSAMRELEPEDDTIILKIHTKKSLHRHDGEAWRKQLFTALLDPAHVAQVRHAYATTPGLAMVAPSEARLAITEYLGVNRSRLDQLIQRFGWGKINTESDHFVAGSMFYIQTAYIKPILNYGPDADAFEAEEGQVDGTMAHALERFIGIAVLRQGGHISEVQEIISAQSVKAA